MNVMTLILSITASVLTAALILVWQSDSSAADKEPEELIKQNQALQTEVKALQTKLRGHEIALKEQAKGNPVASPYGSSIKSVAKIKQDQAEIKAKMAEIQRNNDMISRAPLPEAPAAPKEDLASLEMTSNALTGQPSKTTEEAIVNKEAPTSFEAETVTRTKQRERASEIRSSKIYAKVAHIERNPEGDVVLAKMEPNVFLETNSELSIRRNDGIAGRIRIVDMKEYPEHGTILTIENVSGASLVIKQGDVLILPPRWEAPVTK